MEPKSDQRSTDRIERLPQHCWARLDLAVTRPADPWRTPVFGTMSGKTPALRTVVLRAVDAASAVLTAHTDRRSAKYAQLQFNGQGSWLFWDPETGEQLRCTGAVGLFSGDEHAEAAWTSLSDRSRSLYAQGASPGSALDGGAVKKAALAASLPAEAAFENFVLLRSEIVVMDWLRLAPEGHQRAAMHLTATGWQATAIAP